MLKYLLNFFWPQTKLVTILTVGSDRFPATPSQIKLIKEAFESNETIYWNHTLNIKTIKVPYHSDWLANSIEIEG